LSDRRRIRWESLLRSFPSKFATALVVASIRGSVVELTGRFPSTIAADFSPLRGLFVLLRRRNGHIAIIPRLRPPPPSSLSPPRALRRRRRGQHKLLLSFKKAGSFRRQSAHSSGMGQGKFHADMWTAVSLQLEQLVRSLLVLGRGFDESSTFSSSE